MFACCIVASMSRSFNLFHRRRMFAVVKRLSTLWGVLSLVAVFAFALAACGGGDSGATATTAASSNAAAIASDASTGTSINIREKKDGSGNDTYSFDPATISVNKGETLTIVNLSDEVQDVNEGDASK